jgi:hypothetical protein
MSVVQMECRDRIPGCVNPFMGGCPDVRHLWPAAVQGMGAGRWAHGVMVPHPLRMRGPWVQPPVCLLLGAISPPCDWPRGLNNQVRFGCARAPRSIMVCDS